MINPIETWLASLKTSKRTQIITIIVAVICFGIFGYTTYALYQNQQPATTNTTTTNKHKTKKTINTTTNNTNATESLVSPRRLDGIIVATADANKVPACVMIENAAFDGVRPQAGLSSAQVVYEIIVEGGITRLMGVFGGEHADKVGPVRSARDTYLEFASEYHCGYFHAGGSFTAMQAIRNFDLRDVDGLLEPKWFWRDAGRPSPHNLFTSTDNMYNAISGGHSWTDTPTFASWKFVDDSDIPSGPVATEVNIGFGGSYDVKYMYNTDNKYYERYNGGAAHTDFNTGKILTARNIIIEHVPAGVWLEGKGRINFDVTDSGNVDIIHDGVVTSGFWKKDNREARTHFVNGDGLELPLARGNSWVELVPDGYGVAWK